jgi:hypothetical protein
MFFSFLTVKDSRSMLFFKFFFFFKKLFWERLPSYWSYIFGGLDPTEKFYEIVLAIQNFMVALN